jgi:hypothetical protein
MLRQGSVAVQVVVVTVQWTRGVERSRRSTIEWSRVDEVELRCLSGAGTIGAVLLWVSERKKYEQFGD